jgi:hypothetical protein
MCVKKSKKVLAILMFTTLILTACSTEKNVLKSSKELTISYKELTDEENQLIHHSGGIDGEHFVLNGDIPENHQLELTIEQYKDGELINGVPNTFIDKETYEHNGSFSFAIGTKSVYGSDKAIIGLPGGSLTLNLEGIIEGGYSHGTATNEKVIPKLNKPIYLAYWVNSSGNGLSTPNFSEPGTPDISKYDNALLFKVELKEK